MLDPIAGIHHITAIASDPQRNLDFYTQALGLRLVKLTVNYDDPGTYHFYFGDEMGRPGSILSFFPWPTARRGQRGLRQVCAVAFAIPVHATGYWVDRFKRLEITAAPPYRRFDEEVITLLDPDGLQIELVASRTPRRPGWQAGPVPVEFAIRGLSAPTLLPNHPEATMRLLVETFGLQRVQQTGPRYRFSAGSGAGMQVDVEDRPGEPNGRGGVGTIHHLAWRAQNDAQQAAWREAITALGFEATPILDRNYFHSFYFRENGGLLFEIATEPPGFTLDQPVQLLGSRLTLPPWYEERRAEIERILPPLTLPNQQQVGKKPIENQNGRF